MQSRQSKSKKPSKLKQNLNNFTYASPHKNLPSSFRPKGPPNISTYHLNQQKSKEVKNQYYNKQNKYRGNGNVKQDSQMNTVATVDRLRQKRHTYATNAAQLKKSCQNSNGFQYLKKQRTVIKGENNCKPCPMRQPIHLGALKQKSKILKSFKEKKSSLAQNKFSKKQRPSILKSNIIVQSKQEFLYCWQNLTAEKSSLEQSKVSHQSYYHNQYHHQAQNNNPKGPQKRTIKPRKQGFHKSPKMLLSPSQMISTIKSIPQRTPQEQLAQFDSKINQINTNFQHDCLIYMQGEDFQMINSKNLNCYLDNQVNLDWKKRAIIINWMIQVIQEVHGKRQTLASAVNIFDRYMSVTRNIERDQFQLVAAACMLISGKLQDKSLLPSHLSDTTLNIYSQQKIKEMQFQILTELKWFVNTPTLNSWTNRLAIQWDLYLGSTDLTYYEDISSNLSKIKFKDTDEKSYYNYRQLCQYIDFAIMDIYTLRYQPRMLSLAFIYIIMMMRLEICKKQDVISKFPYCSDYLFEVSTFNLFFEGFLKDSFTVQIELRDLLPMIQYCATFVILPLNFNLPQSANDDNSDEQVHYQDFCSILTKNQNSFKCLGKRCRDIY